MGQWTIYGPDKPYLTKLEVCAFLGVSEATLDQQVRQGRFPPGVKPSPQAEPLWAAVDIACWWHLARLLFPAVPEKPGRPSQDEKT